MPSASSIDREEQPPLLQSLPNAVITSLGLSLLLRSDHYSTVILASALAILSKFVLQVRGKHLFNPANFGIVATLTLTGDAWVSPGQWGETQWCALLFVGAGGVVLRRVGHLDRHDSTDALQVSLSFFDPLRISKHSLSLLVVCQSSNCGSRRLSRIRASAVVNCQSTDFCD